MVATENDVEWDEYESEIVEILGLSQFDYENLVIYAAEMGVGEQLSYM